MGSKDTMSCRMQVVLLRFAFLSPMLREDTRGVPVPRLEDISSEICCSFTSLPRSETMAWLEVCWLIYKFLVLSLLISFKYAVYDSNQDNKVTTSLFTSLFGSSRTQKMGQGADSIENPVRHFPPSGICPLRARALGEIIIITKHDIVSIW